MFEDVERMHMPIIAPPPPGVDPSTFYGGLGITVTPTSLGDDGVIFEIDTPQTLYAICDGFVRFIPKGKPYPNSNISVGGNGAVVLEVIWRIIDHLTIQNLVPGGVPIPNYIAYENADKDLFESAVTPQLDFIPVKILDESWKETESSPPPADPAIKKAKYLERLLGGEKSLWVEGGWNLGGTTVNLSGKPEFTLRFLQNNFVGNNAPIVTLISPVFFIRRFPEFVDAMGNPSKWTEHPLITSTNGIQVPVNFFLMFEVWNPNYIPGSTTIPEYVPVEAGATVELKQVLQYWFDPTILTKTTDSNGAVHFQLPAIDENSPKPTFYFNILHPVATATGLNLPSEWATAIDTDHYWEAADGTPGFYVDFYGSQIGNSLNPIKFRIGFDYHIKFELHNPYFYTHATNTVLARDEFFPDGIFVRLYSSQYISPFSKSEFTDFLPTYQVVELRKILGGFGEIHGITFMVPPGNSVFWGVEYVIEDEAINLKESKVKLMDIGHDDSFLIGNDIWVTSYGLNSTVPGQPVFNHYKKASIGSFSQCQYFFPSTGPIDRRRVGFYILKCYRELSTFIHYFTNGAFEGINLDILMFHPVPTATATSYPPGTIYLPRRIYYDPNTGAQINPNNENNWKRSTIIHEISHQLMWSEAGYTAGAILYQFLIDIVAGGIIHDIHYFSNRKRALTEGWAAALEVIFEGRDKYSALAKLDKIERHTFFDVSGSGAPNYPELFLGPGNFTNAYGNFDIPTNFGEFCEGAFANIVYFIFWKFVVADTYMADNLIIESINGNIQSSNSWMNTANQSALSTRFEKFIWGPLGDIGNFVDNFDLLPESTDFYEEILEECTNIERAKVVAEMQRWNCRVFTPPVITSASYDITSGVVVILGTNFVIELLPDLSVELSNAAVLFLIYFNGIPASIISTSFTEIQCYPPTGLTGSVLIKAAHSIRGKVFDSNVVSINL